MPTTLIAEAPIDLCRRIRTSFDSSDYVLRRLSEMFESQRPLAHFLNLPGHSPYSHSESPRLAGLYVWDVMNSMEEAPKVAPRTIINNLRAFWHHKQVYPCYIERFLEKVSIEQPYLIGELGILIDSRLKHGECMNVGLSVYWMLRTQKSKDELLESLASEGIA